MIYGGTTTIVIIGKKNKKRKRNKITLIRYSFVRKGGRDQLVPAWSGSSSCVYS
jgi:hypothetical protein